MCVQGFSMCRGLLVISLHIIRTKLWKLWSTCFSQFLNQFLKKKVCVRLYSLFPSSHSLEIPPAFHFFLLITIHVLMIRSPTFTCAACLILFLTSWPQNLSQQPAGLFRWSSLLFELDRYFKVKGKHSAFASGGGLEIHRETRRCLWVKKATN